MSDLPSFTTLDGAKISYKVLGGLQECRKRPLLLIMGLSGVLEDWEPLDRELARRRPVIIFDHRGMGHSTSSSDELSVDIMADDVLQLLLHLELKEVDALGFSMGGVILQNLLVRDSLPVKIKHSILAATMPRRLRRTESVLISAMEQSNNGQYEGLPKAERQRKAIEALMRLQYDEEWLKDEANQKWMEKRVQTSLNTRRPAKQILLQSQSLAGISFLDKLPSIPSTTKVLWLCGKKDSVVSRSVSILIPQAIKHAEIVDGIDGIGLDFAHFFWDYGKVEDWVTVFERFLDDTSVGNGHVAKSKL
ncbi:alpha/beta-hydrolase [Atractiella rhizophila]|nr:alpha/beta-hydrolase [Atractiella rhizophila]